MNLFDKLVDEALRKSNAANIRPVVEKELLHHDIAHKTLTQPEFWMYIISQTIDESHKVINCLKEIAPYSSAFPMS